MNRRDALKSIASLTFAFIGGASGLTAFAAASDPAPVPLLQGTADGRVLESRDGGHTWTTVAKFGSHTSVESLQVVGDRVYARIKVGPHPFVLSSGDARTWYTSQ